MITLSFSWWGFLLFVLLLSYLAPIGYRLGERHAVHLLGWWEARRRRRQLKNPPATFASRRAQ